MIFTATVHEAGAGPLVSRMPMPALGCDVGHRTNLPTPCAAGLASQQEGRAQSTGTSHRQTQSVGLARAGSHGLMASAERRTRHSAYPRTDRAHARTSRD